MSHNIDVNGVQAVEVEPIFPNLMSAHLDNRYSRRVVVRTTFGLTTLTLRAADASYLEISEVHAPGPPSRRTRTAASPKNKK